MGKPTIQSPAMDEHKSDHAFRWLALLFALLMVPLTTPDARAQNIRTDLNLSPERIAVTPPQSPLERYSDASQRAIAIGQLKDRLARDDPADEADDVFTRLNAEATRRAILEANYALPVPMPKPVIPVEPDEAAALTLALARHRAGVAAVAELEALDAQLATSGDDEALLQQFVTVLGEARRLSGDRSTSPDWTGNTGRIVSGVTGGGSPVGLPDRLPGIGFETPPPRIEGPSTPSGSVVLPALPPTVAFPPVIGRPQVPPRVGGGNTVAAPSPPPIIGEEPIIVAEPDIVADLGEDDGSGSAESALHVEISAYLPVFTPFPPPAPSVRAPIARTLFEGEGAQSLGDVSDILEDALAEAQYRGSSYLGIPGGFALVTQIEQTDSAGTPLDSQARWLPTIPALRGFTLRHYLQALFGAPAGFFRGIAIFVTDQPIDTTPDARGQLRTVEAWSDRGRRRLPEQVGAIPLTDEHTITVYIYEFRKRTEDDVETIDPSGISASDHLAHTALAQHVRDF